MSKPENKLLRKKPQPNYNDQEAAGCKRLNLVFKETGTTQMEFAKESGVSQPQFNKMLKGKQEINMAVLRYCCKLGYSVTWLVNGKGPHKETTDKNSTLVTDVKELNIQLDIQRERLDNLEYFLKSSLKIEFLPESKWSTYYKELA